MIWFVSWRNIWRNRVRSGVIIMAISLGIFAGVFMMAFFRGIANQRLESAIMTEISHIQIHTPRFSDVSDIEFYFKDSQEILDSLRSASGVIGASRRVVLNIMISSAEKSTGIKLVGVEPEMEKQVTLLYEKVDTGSYLNSMKRGRPILIGKKLADKLDVNTGSKVVAGMLDLSGQPVYHQFRVSGIFNTSSGPFEEGTAFVRYSDLLEITGLPPNSAHEISVLLDNEDRTAEIVNRISGLLPELEVKSWNQIMPELNYLTETLDYYMYIFIIIILLALGFGIVNTMLMTVLERIKELGMLMAVGMNKKRIFSMIMLETVYLSLTGGVIGILLGSAASLYFGSKGIDLSSLYGAGLEAVGYDSLIYTVLQPEFVVIITILVILTGIIASVYPALKALKLNPADAIRTDA